MSKRWGACRVFQFGIIVNLLPKFCYPNQQFFDSNGKATKAEVGEYQWKQFRFTFKEEEGDVESFYRQLVQMGEEAVKKVSSCSGLG